MIKLDKIDGGTSSRHSHDGVGISEAMQRKREWSIDEGQQNASCKSQCVNYLPSLRKYLRRSHRHYTATQGASQAHKSSRSGADNSIYHNWNYALTLRSFALAVSRPDILHV